jgi:hypothetical protein
MKLDETQYLVLPYEEFQSYFLLYHYNNVRLGWREYFLKEKVRLWPNNNMSIITT